eukprot:gnl/Spiro4/9713_TR5165_c0_g1_i1.p1 gnl/Spiro4/9713_TR5165_c0_g1~~gnl/Spiro4/9713_TR5165_c0_g1_i1.p1  ORF type:complete len:438 (-),score=115.92 gnl/Spiro4/9713_TR5165_c0_g1_i1:128-1381(-)
MANIAKDEGLSPEEIAALRRTTVVCDNGTGYVKAGFAGSNFPHSTIPALIGRPILRAEENVLQGVQMSDILVGAEASALRSQLEITYPMETGIIKNQEDMYHLWDYTFRKLEINPRECNVLLTEPPFNPKSNKVFMVETMFNKYGFKGVNVQLQAVLTLYANGLLTGCVVDSGDGVTHVIPVVRGNAYPHLIKRLDIAGRHINNYLAKLLQLRGYALNRTADQETIRDIKERFCYTAVDLPLERRLALETTVLTETYELPDGRVVRIGAERFEAPEVLFDPKLLDIETPGLSRLIFDTIQGCDIDNRLELYKRIVLSGGSTMLPGLPTRLERDIRALYIEHVLRGDASRLQDPNNRFQLKIEDPPRRKHNVFIGGAVLADVVKREPNFWITKEEWDREGPACLDKPRPEAGQTVPRR